MTTRYLVLPDNGDQTIARPAYTSREHAEAVAAVNRHEYPTLGPWRIVEMREVSAEPAQAVAA